MPLQRSYCSSPTAGTHDEQQRLLRPSNSGLAGYSATDESWGAPSERSFASGLRGGSTPSDHNSTSNGQGIRSNTLPPQYIPEPMDGYGTSQSHLFNTDEPILTPKIGQTKRPRKFDLGSNRRWHIFMFILGGLVAWFIQDMWAMAILNPSAMERRRLGWDRDYSKHLAQASTILQEREQWDKDRAQWQAERREYDLLEQERMKLELELKRRALEKEKEKEKEEKEEKEEEARKRAGLKWQDPQPDQHCLRFGTRRYTAKLENVPKGYNGMKACHEIKAWINGRWVTPAQCDDGGAWNGVHGTWFVDWEEGPCRTYFEDFKDKGCTAEGSGKRRIESQIQNIRSGDDGLRMCASTPADFHGLHFDAPHSCVYWGIYPGIWALWFIDDGACA